MAWLRRLPDGLGLYQEPDHPAWPVGEAREVDDEHAARLLTDHPARFATCTPPSLAPAAPSLTRGSASSAAATASGAALDVDAMGYRDLQAALKERGASAAGSTETLRARLLGLLAG